MTRRPPTFIGVRLRALREQAGMRQLDLANLAGVSRTQIANIEAGRGDPSMAAFIAIVAALSADATELLRQPRCQHCGDQPPPGFSCLTCGSPGSPTTVGATDTG